jgi:hypothetical protein
MSWRVNWTRSNLSSQPDTYNRYTRPPTEAAFLRLDNTTIAAFGRLFHFRGHMDTKEMIAENEQRIAVHEAVCAERYAGILDKFSRGEKRMQRIEYIMYFLVLAVLFGPAGALKMFEALFK